jgi:hypothetical protein
MGDVRDIPVDGPPKKDFTDYHLKVFRKRIQEDGGRLAYNAGVYAQKRASKSWLTPKLSRILQGATFVPAHHIRFAVGGLTKSPITFVVHRPGAFEPRLISGRLGDPTLALYIVREFSTSARKASTHFIVKRDGSIIQVVDLQDAAYHTGTSRSPNNYDSVGAELEGYIGEDPPVSQRNGLARLVRMIADQYGWGPTIDRTRLIGHSEIKSDKPDPGAFPYEDVIQRVNLHSRFSQGAIFRPPLDLRSDIDAETATVLNAAASEARKEVREVYISAAGVMNARQRSAGLLFQTPSDLASASVFNSDRVRRGQELHLAYMMRAEQMFKSAEPTPQENVSGALFDFETGEWNDAE